MSRRACSAHNVHELHRRPPRRQGSGLAIAITPSIAVATAWGRRFLALWLTATSLLQAGQPPAREVWIDADTGTPPGDGTTRQTPRDGSTQPKLDAIIEALHQAEGEYGAGVVVHLLPGHYETGGIRLGPNWWLLGEGKESTVLKRVPLASERRFSLPYYPVIHGGWGPQADLSGSGNPLPERDYGNLRVCDLTLDCNWTGLKTSLGSMVKKAAGLSLLCREVEVARVKVVHFGAQGGRAAWREVFPILILSSLMPTAEYPGYGSAVVDIHDCEIVGPVEGPDHPVEWPYCTGIGVTTPHVDVERQRVEVRVHHNQFRDIANGIAFGGAYLNGAVFEHNVVTRCYMGFNYDTGVSQNVVIRHNTFLECGGGGTAANAIGFLIESNVVEIVGTNVGKRAWANHGFRFFDYTRQFQVLHNQIRLAPNTGPVAGDPHGILVHGAGVGIRWLEEPPGHWVPLILRHVIRDNAIDTRLPNRLGPQDPDYWLFAEVDGRSIDLSGYPDRSDGVLFEWRDDGELNTVAPGPGP